MLKIWGRITSINVQKVAWCCDEMGLPYERIDAGGTFGKTKTPEYLAMNPNSLVPTIDDGGFILYESNAIVRYLAAKHSADKLWPTDLARRADTDRWMDWNSTTFIPAMRDAFWQLIRTPEPQRDLAAVEKSRAESEKGAAILDVHLAKHRYMTDFGFTVADIVVGCATHRWLLLPLRREPRPHLQRWYDEIRSRPGARQVTSLVLS